MIKTLLLLLMTFLLFGCEGYRSAIVVPNTTHCFRTPIGDAVCHSSNFGDSFFIKRDDYDRLLQSNDVVIITIDDTLDLEGFKKKVCMKIKCNFSKKMDKHIEKMIDEYKTDVMFYPFDLFIEKDEVEEGIKIVKEIY